MQPNWWCGMDARRSKTADVWRERVVAQQASGRPVRAWCRAHGCHEHGFYWWRAKLGLSPTSAAARRQRRRTRAIHFAGVVVERPEADPVVLRLRGGRELVLPPSMPVTRLAELLRVIEAAS
jgi:hypothetical protein